MPRKILDITGQRFGRLVVIKRTDNTAKGKPMWLCQCDCGNIKAINGSCLVGGMTKSCGCYNKELAAERQLKHGGCRRNEEREALYNTWSEIKRRCETPTSHAYKYYGGRGIKLCPEWHDYANFRKWAYENGYNPNVSGHKCSIDRIDVNGNYEPSNCRWVDALTQANNTRSNHLVTYKGNTYTVSELARKIKMSYPTLLRRINIGWDIEKAVNTEVMNYGK